MKRIKKMIAMTLMAAMVLAGVISQQTVNADAATKSLNYKKKTIEQTKTFTLSVKNRAKTDKVTFSSENKEIAKVSKKGVVTGVSAGDVKIKVKITDKKKKSKTLSCAVTVQPLYVPVLSDVALVQDGDMILSDGSNITLNFKSDKTTQATVSVCDSSDDVVYKKKINTKKNAMNSITWNGKDTKGAPVSADSYYFVIDSDTAQMKSEYFSVYATSEFAGGTGSASKPYVITNLDQFRKIVAHNGCSFELATDIDMEFGALVNLFSEDNPFTGTFDGKGHTISNLLNTAPIFVAVGETGTIKNLNVDNITYNDAANGMLVKVNKGTIDQCSVTNAVSGQNSASLIARQNYGTIKNCKAQGTASGSSKYSLCQSGIVMYNEQTGKVLNCTVDAEFNLSTSSYSGSYVGGIVAVNNGLINACSSSGTYEVHAGGGSRWLYAGSIAGKNDGSIQNCYYTGSQADLPIAGTGSGVVN